MHRKTSRITVCCLLIFGLCLWNFPAAAFILNQVPCCLDEYNGIICEENCKGQDVTSETNVCGDDMEVNYVNALTLEDVLRRFGKCIKHLYLEHVAVPFLVRPVTSVTVNMTELEEISISNTKFIHEWNFSLLETKNLRFFVVQDSNLAVLTRSRFFRNVDKMRSFVVENSGLYLIEDGFFRDMPILYLKISRNKITQIKSTHLGSRKVQLIDFSDNDINYVDGMAFHDCTELAELDLSGNKIDSLPNYVFKSNAKLNNVKLSKNRIETVDFCALGFRLSRPYFSFYLEGNPLHCDTKQMNWLCAENCGSFLPDDTKNTRCVDLSPHETLEIFRKSCNGTQPPGRGCKECSVQ